MHNNPDTFPRLRYDLLKIQAKRWANSYPSICQITLHHCSDSINVKHRYVVVWKVFDKSNHDIFDLDFVMDKASGALFSSNFYEVYRTDGYDNDYRNEWNVEKLNYDEDFKMYDSIFSSSEYWLLYSTKFELSESSFGKLEDDEIPSKIIRKIKKLQGKSFSKINEFDIAVESEFNTEELSSDEFNQYKLKIFKHAFQEDIDSQLLNSERELHNIIDLYKNEENAFIEIGDNWIIKFKGKQTTIKNILGLGYIAFLLDNPFKKFPGEDLEKHVKGHDVLLENEKEVYKRYAKMPEEQLASESLSLSDMKIDELTPENKRYLEDSLRYLYDELNSAKKNGDEEEIKKAKKNFEEVKGHLLNEYGIFSRESSKNKIIFKYKSRLASDFERIRTRVTKNINNARNEIKEKNMPELYKHLKIDLKTGMKCIYDPDKESSIEWFIKWND